MPVDVSVYLVTDRGLVPPGKDYYDSLEQSLKGGVTVVQIREKHANTSTFLDVAAKSKEICDRYDVPMLINDRLDIALAVNASGVHVGQDDMPLTLARKLLPKGSIIGVSCNTVRDVQQAVLDGADYVGIGPVWPTPTKTDTEPAIGVRGLGVLLAALEGSSVGSVAIGGIKHSNLVRVLHASPSLSGKRLDGVAVVSEIMASRDPQASASNLAKILRVFKSSSINPLPAPTTLSVEIILGEVLNLFSKIRDVNPLVHQITNTVVIAQSANITLALGASPIMATTPEEMEDLSRIPGALLINIGTLRSGQQDGMLKAGHYANLARKPVVMDPVGVGATQFRKDIVDALLNEWQASVIKGNAGELAALARSSEVLSKGVDTVGSGFKDPVSFVRNLAKKEKCVIVLTGPTDYISSASGDSVVSIHNGNPILGQITGSGCMVGSSIAAYAGVATAIARLSGKTEPPESILVDAEIFMAAIAGILVVTVSAELAVAKYSPGPGSFLGHLLDEISGLQASDLGRLAKIQLHT